MSRIRSAVVCLALGLLLALPASALQGSEWKPLLVADQPVPDETSAYIQFRSHGRLRGFSGCNQLFAEYEAIDNHLFVGPVRATRQVCAASVMQREAELAAALENARTFHRDRIRLVIFDAAGRPMLELRQTDWD